MENKTLLIVVALLLAGLVIIFVARDLNSRDANNGKDTFEHAESGK